MNEDIKIVPCEEKYLEAVEELTAISWGRIYNGYREAIGEDIFEGVMSDWREVKCNHVKRAMMSGRGYVALMDGKVAGFIYYLTDENKKVGTIGENSVYPQYRGCGIGGKMYEFVLEKMKCEGMKYATVTTGLDDAHAPARRAYEKAGFEKNVKSVKYYKEL